MSPRSRTTGESEADTAAHSTVPALLDAPSSVARALARREGRELQQQMVRMELRTVLAILDVMRVALLAHDAADIG